MRLLSRILQSAGTHSSRPRPMDVTGPYSALAISNEMTLMGMRRSPMGHNKLVQIVQGTALALGRSLVEEMPLVWRYGPVIHSLYLIQNHLGHSIVERPLSAGPFDLPPRVDPEDTWTLDLIRKVVEGHAAVSTLDLSSMLHAEETPWKQVAAENDFRVPAGTTVPAWRIQQHYHARMASR